MINESITDDIVNDFFRNDELYKQKYAIIERQSSTCVKINKLLENASKKGHRQGRPDFIIQYIENPNLIIVIESKAEKKYHKSESLDKYSQYAVDGVLLYASFLSKEYDVLAIAVSGKDNTSLRISHHLQLKGTQEAHKIFNEDKFLSLSDYLNGYKKDERKFNQDFQKLLKYSKTLNDKLHILKIKESNRSLLISGTLIALSDKAFVNSYKFENPQSLVNLLVNKIKEKLSSVQNQYIQDIATAYSFITTHTVFSKQESVLKEIIDEIDEKINSFIKNYQYFDTLGQFYIEFLRYANNDKGLGIVLTPPHITELFSEIANISKDSVVLDTCTGTGGFLISAMKKMIIDAGGDNKKESNIKQQQIVGVELQHDLYSLLCSNMYIHGDGRSNLIKGNCFDNDVKNQISCFKPNVGLLNPPYKTNKNDIEELEFVLNALDLLQKGSLCIAIIPMSCMLAKKGTRLALKEKILNNHTLEAAFSMPDELFINSKVDVITSIIVLKAKEKHPSNYKTYFAYFKEDGFYKKKVGGRSDYDDKWSNIKNYWVENYKNKDEVEGHSIKASVSACDEWCAEAFMKTNYNNINKNIFEAEILRYSTYMFFNKRRSNVSRDRISNKDINLDISNYKEFYLGDLFNIQKGLDKVEDIGYGTIPMVSATRYNNGISGYVDETNKLFNTNTITVVSNGASTGEAFYQSLNYCATGDVNILKPKFNLNIYCAMFIISLIRLDKYKFSYGRKWGKTRMEISIIKLPAIENNNGNHEPDFEFMENYIKSLPYSSNL